MCLERPCFACGDLMFFPWGTRIVILPNDVFVLINNKIKETCNKKDVEKYINALYTRKWAFSRVWLCHRNLYVFSSFSRAEKCG